MWLLESPGGINSESYLPFPAGSIYPIRYQEVETVLVHATTPTLIMAILGSFCTNSGWMIWQAFGQTGDFLNGVVEECPNIEITDQLSLMNWISLLLSWALSTNKLPTI